MSNISRRKFLKGAGVAALAVAAAGVLAGCSKDDVPVIPEVTAKDVTVKFVDRNGKEVDSIIVKDVKLTETKMNSNDVKAPEGYVIGIVGDQPIDWKKQTVTFTTRRIPRRFRFSTITAKATAKLAPKLLKWRRMPLALTPAC